MFFWNSLAFSKIQRKTYIKTKERSFFFSSEQPNTISQAEFRNGSRTRDQSTNLHWIIEKAREFQQNIYFCFIDYVKAFDCVDHNKLWKILKRDGNTRPPDLLPEKSIGKSRSHCQNGTWNNGLVLNWERSKTIMYIVTQLI